MYNLAGNLPGASLCPDKFTRWFDLTVIPSDKQKKYQKLLQVCLPNYRCQRRTIHTFRGIHFHYRLYHSLQTNNSMDVFQMAIPQMPINILLTKDTCSTSCLVSPIQNTPNNFAEQYRSRRVTVTNALLWDDNNGQKGL